MNNRGYEPVGPSPNLLQQRQSIEKNCDPFGLLGQRMQIGHLVQRVASRTHQPDTVHRHLHIVCNKGNVGRPRVARIDCGDRSQVEIPTGFIEQFQQRVVSFARGPGTTDMKGGNVIMIQS